MGRGPNKHQLVAYIWHICETCGSAFLRGRWYNYKRMFCSPECRINRKPPLGTWYRCEVCDTPVLELKRKATERRFCSKRCQGLVVNGKPERREMSRQLLIALNKTDERREANRDRFLKMHQDPVFLAKLTKVRSERFKMMNKTPEYRKRSSEWMKTLNKIPEFVEAKRERSRVIGRRCLIEYNTNPENRRFIYQQRLSSALGFPPEWQERQIDLRPARGKIEGCGYYARVDLLHPASHTVIEVDGRYHDSEERAQKDHIRDAALTFMGWHVIRVKNEEIESDLDVVTCKVLAVIESRY